MPFLPPNQQCQSTEGSYRLLKCTDINTVDSVNSGIWCLRRWIVMQFWITNNSNNKAYCKYTALTDILHSTLRCHSNKTHAMACTNCKYTLQCTTRGHPLAFRQVTSGSVQKCRNAASDRQTHTHTHIDSRDHYTFHVIYDSQYVTITDWQDNQPFTGLLFQDNMGKPAPDRLNQSGF